MAESNKDWQTQEKEAARKAVGKLRPALRSSIGRHFNNRTGRLQKTNVSAKFQYGHLDRLVITSPKYSFILHHGYNEPSERVSESTRRPSSVKSHFRGGSVGMGKTVKAYHRAGGTVSTYKRNISFEGAGHIAEAINNSNVLETLADDLAESRAVEVISKISV